MPIIISIENGIPRVYNSLDRKNEPVVLSDYETHAIQIINKALSDAGINTENIHLERRTDSYLTIVSGKDCDFCRIKVTSRTAWFSLDLWLLTSELANDSRLFNVKNKNQRHWKIPLCDVGDLQNYNDLIVMSYKASCNY